MSPAQQPTYLTIDVATVRELLEAVDRLEHHERLAEACQIARNVADALVMLAETESAPPGHPSADCAGCGIFHSPWSTQVTE